MELLGFRKSMQYLTDSQLDISTFISDRHTSIAKCMRENYNGITHYYDLWHLAKSKMFLLFVILHVIKPCFVFSLLTPSRC